MTAPTTPQPPFADTGSRLLGTKEVAELLHVSRQRLYALARSYPDFPPPAAHLSAGKVWTYGSILDWLAAHPSRPPGRPRKQRAQD